MVLSTFMMLCNHYYYLVAELFHDLKQKPHLSPRSFLLAPSNHKPDFCLYGFSYPGYLILME